MYAERNGVAKDSVEAVKWYRKAAEQGHAFAQSDLGDMYASGEGVPKDSIEALAWYNLAAASGNWSAAEAAVKNRAVLERQLGPQVTLAAQQRSKQLMKTIEQRKQRQKAGSGGVEPAAPNAPEIKCTGTGSFISADGVVLTAAHVVEGATSVKVLTEDGLKKARVLQVDAANDVALLKCDGKFNPLPIAGSRGVKLGQTVFTIGFPNVGLQGFSPKLTKGEISSVTGIQDDPRHWQISVPVQPGNSGGPLFDENGNIVGVVVHKLSQKAALRASGSLVENVNYALKSAYIQPLLEAVPSIPENKAGTPGKLEDVVERAKRSVVLVVVY